MFQVNTEHYIGGNMFVGVLSIIPKINADVHYAAFGPLNYGSIRELIGPLFQHLFDTYGLNRLTAYIPAPNKEALRVATLAGFKYEGEMRGMFLRNDVYHNLQVWGLTKADFSRRG
jgi:RimJ/RimL family protein N-acetyltransferase